MESQKTNDAIDEMYKLFVSKIENEFKVDDYSENYTKYPGSLNLIINKNELDVSFVNNVQIIFNFWKKNQQVIPIEYEFGEWFVQPHTDWNNSSKAIKFDESYLNRIIRHFKAISKTS